MKFTPTFLSLPCVVFLACFNVGQEEGPTLSAVAPAEGSAPARVSEEEVHRLLEAARDAFGNQPPSRKPAPACKCEGIEVRFKHPKVEVLIDHPRIERESLPLRRALQTHLQERTLKAKEKFEEYLEQREEEDASLEVWEYSESWSEELGTEDVVSLSCFGSYYNGGAHRNAFQRSRTYWVNGRQARVARLEDLFDPCTPWQNKLSELVLAGLRAAEASKVLSGELVSLDDRLLECWVLTPHGIEFLIDPYEAGCHAEGSFGISINYRELREFLNPAGPAAEFLR